MVAGQRARGNLFALPLIFDQAAMPGHGNEGCFEQTNAAASWRNDQTVVRAGKNAEGKTCPCSFDLLIRINPGIRKRPREFAPCDGELAVIETANPPLLTHDMH